MAVEDERAAAAWDGGTGVPADLVEVGRSVEFAVFLNPEGDDLAANDAEAVDGDVGGIVGGKIGGPVEDFFLGGFGFVDFFFLDGAGAGGDGALGTLHAGVVIVLPEGGFAEEKGESEEDNPPEDFGKIGARSSSR